MKQARQISLLVNYLDNLKIYGVTTANGENATDAIAATATASLLTA